MGLHNKLLYMACHELPPISYFVAIRPSPLFFWLDSVMPIWKNPVPFIKSIFKYQYVYFRNMLLKNSYLIEEQYKL